VYRLRQFLWALTARVRREERDPFFAHLNHSQLGAERAREAGCDGLTVELIQLHHEPLSSAGESEADRLLAALQAADGQV